MSGRDLSDVFDEISVYTQWYEIHKENPELFNIEWEWTRQGLLPILIWL